MSAGEQNTQIPPLLATTKEDVAKQRKLTTNYKHFTRLVISDNIQLLHLKEQHPLKKFKEYMSLRSTSAACSSEDIIMTSLFSQPPTLDAFFERRSTIVGRKRIVTIDKSIDLSR